MTENIALLGEFIDPIKFLIEELCYQDDPELNQSFEVEFKNYNEKQDIFLKFFEGTLSNNWNSEEEFQAALIDCLNECAIPGRKAFSEPKSSDSSHAGIQIRMVDSVERATQPCFFFDLKVAFNNEIDLPQTLDRVRLILGNHCENEALPFAMMDMKGFIVGLASWSNYSRLYIRHSKKPHIFSNKNNELDTEAIKKLFKFICIPPVLRKKVFQDEQGNAFKIKRIAGQGSSSTVYRASRYICDGPQRTAKRLKSENLDPLVDIDNIDKDGPVNVDGNFGELYSHSPPLQSVLKFSRNFAALRNEISIDGLLQERFRMGWQRNPEPFRINEDPCYLIIGKYLKPVVRSVFTQAEDVSELKLTHMNGLLDNLLDFHRIGYAHGDVRLPNVFLNDDDDAILGDFGACTGLSTKNDFQGGYETASQRVLSWLEMGSLNIWLYQADDLEALLKLYLIAFMGANPPETFDPRALFDYWIKNPVVCIFWKLQSNKEKISYLRSFFTVHDLSSFRLTMPPFDRSIETDIIEDNRK